MKEKAHDCSSKAEAQRSRDAKRETGDRRQETRAETEQTSELKEIDATEAMGTDEQPEIENPKSEIHNVLDPAAIETLLAVIGGEHALLVELIDSFLETAPPLLARLEHGVAAGNAANMQQAAEWLAGLSERVIMQQTGHKNTAMLHRYIREDSLFRENAVSAVGL